MKNIEDVKRETKERLAALGYAPEITEPLVNSFWKITGRNRDGEPTAVLTAEGQEIYL